MLNLDNGSVNFDNAGSGYLWFSFSAIYKAFSLSIAGLLVLLGGVVALTRITSIPISYNESSSISMILT